MIYTNNNSSSNNNNNNNNSNNNSSSNNNNNNKQLEESLDKVPFCRAEVTGIEMFYESFEYPAVSLYKEGVEVLMCKWFPPSCLNNMQ